MVLTHQTNHTYSHPFPTVTLAFFLRYCSPRLNPFSTHVLSTDTISSHIDAETGRLHTTRLHVKKSRMPSAVIRMLPQSLTGGAGDKSAYVLETSVVDIKEGWMKTESRNLNWTGVLSVVEQQQYSITPPEQPEVPEPGESRIMDLVPALQRPLSPNTYVTTTFSYRSSLGNRKAAAQAAAEVNEAAQEKGRFGNWISGWSAKGIQRSIESIASNKANDQLMKSRDGMKLILERLKSNGVVAVLRELKRQEGAGVFEAKA